MKANEQFFSIVLFIMLYKVVLTFQFMDKFLDHLSEKYSAGRSFGAVCFMMFCKIEFGLFISFPC